MYIQDIIPDLIEIGLDVLHSRRPGIMGISKIMEKYKKEIAFWGLVDEEKIISYGSEKDIIKEIRERVKFFGKTGAFILSPSFTLRSGVPLKNVQAFAEAANKYCC